MEDVHVQFNEGSYKIHTPRSKRRSFITLLIKKGLAKDERQAIYILFGIIAACFVVATMVLFTGTSKPNLQYEGGSNPEFQTS